MCDCVTVCDRAARFALLPCTLHRFASLRFEALPFASPARHFSRFSLRLHFCSFLPVGLFVSKRQVTRSFRGSTPSRGRGLSIRDSFGRDIGHERVWACLLFGGFPPKWRFSFWLLCCRSSLLPSAVSQGAAPGKGQGPGAAVAAPAAGEAEQLRQRRFGAIRRGKAFGGRAQVCRCMAKAYESILFCLDPRGHGWFSHLLVTFAEVEDWMTKVPERQGCPTYCSQVCHFAGSLYCPGGI